MGIHMAYVLPERDLNEALQLHSVGHTGLAYQRVSAAIERDGGHVHPCVIDWLALTAQAGGRKSWLGNILGKLNAAEQRRLQLTISDNFFGLLRRSGGRMPGLETLMDLDAMSALRETGANDTPASALLPSANAQYNRFFGS